MKKGWIAGCGITLSIVALSVIGYQGVTDYMKDRFAPNTWVDGVYCTGRTVEDVNGELIKECVSPIVTVKDSDGKAYELDMASTDYQFDFSQSLSAYQQHQAKNGWWDMMFQENQISKGAPEVSYNETKVSSWWEELPIVQKEQKTPIYKLVYDKDGYQLKSTLDGHLDTNMGLTELVKSIGEKDYEISLADKGCYFDYELDDEQKETLAVYEKMLDLERCGLTIDMGDEKIVFDESLMGTFIAKDTLGYPIKDEDGQYGYDLAYVESYFSDLFERYHTYGVERPFLASRGEVVMVPAGTYGTEIDKKTEVAYVLDYLTNEEVRKTKTIHTPIYLHETPVKGLNDIGGTYVEVDMTEQKIYFYKDYELMISSGVVTGNLRTRHGTPSGVFYIYGKYKNRVLRGPGYASYVRRWMPVVRAIGLHDANWRDEFGGDIYKKNGSHGCVNMPDETTDVIFDNAEIGTPVLIFY